MTAASHLAAAYLDLADEHELAAEADLAAVERGYVRGILQRALTSAETDAGSLNSLAWMVATRDLHLEAALEAAARAAQLQPDSPEILDTLAEVHWRLGDVEQAIRVAEQALALSPDDGYLKRQLERFQGIDSDR
jgi:tetratricopeptide (TPR) repeat protein